MASCCGRLKGNPSEDTADLITNEQPMATTETPPTGKSVDHSARAVNTWPDRTHPSAGAGFLEPGESEPGPRSLTEVMDRSSGSAELRLRRDNSTRGSSAPVSGSVSPHRIPSGTDIAEGAPVTTASQTDGLMEMKSIMQAHGGYGMCVAGIFLVSVSVGANLLNVPQAMSHLGWIAVPIISLLAIQSCFCSCLLGRCWEMVESLDPSLSGPIHKPYPLISQRVLGSVGRILTSLIVLVLDFLSAVMLMVLASDLITSMIDFVYPDAQPTICFMTLMLAVFLCPFTWFNSPKNFWMLAVIGLSTTLLAWVLMLMKMCADNCNRHHSPPRTTQVPLHMMVGLSGICNSFTSAGVQPSIQVDMRNRRDFSRSVVVVWCIIATLILAFGITSYVLIGSDAKSNILHNMENGRLLLIIQLLMLLHVLTSFIIYLNPVFQELEETLHVNPGAWQQYVLRTLCMLLVLVVSEATPDFGNALNIISVLSLLTTLVMPPFLYLKLAGVTGIKLNGMEQAFLAFLTVTGLVYMTAAACGTANFVFVEQKQGSCLSTLHQRLKLELSNVSATTPGNQALIYKAHFVTLKPPN